jgi:hypothetical protein
MGKNYFPKSSFGSKTHTLGEYFFTVVRVTVRLYTIDSQLQDTG